MTPRRLWLNKIPTQCDVVIEFPGDIKTKRFRNATVTSIHFPCRVRTRARIEMAAGQTEGSSAIWSGPTSANTKSRKYKVYGPLLDSSDKYVSIWHLMIPCDCV